MSEPQTIFHKIVAGEAPAYIIAEDENHMAFLDIFPSRKAQTVVIPKRWAASAFADVENDIVTSTTLFAQKVAKQLEAKLSEIYRVLVVIEGLEIDYFHIKLIPAFGPKDGIPTGGTRADAAELQALKEALTV